MMEDQKLIYNGYTFESLTQKISRGVYRDSLINRKKHDRETPMYYGNVCFWLQDNEKGTILVYNLHPSKWDVNSIIVDIETDDQNYYEKYLGWNFNWDSYGQIP